MVVLAVLLGGVAILAGAYGIGAMQPDQPGYQSVLSQLVGAVSGRGAFYYVAMGSLLAILCLSANTSFVGFPRLCRMVAADGFLPRPSPCRGGGWCLPWASCSSAASAAMLLVAFRRHHRPADPAVRHRRLPDLHHLAGRHGGALAAGGGNWPRLAMNAVGATATGIALIIILVAKFMDGAWITLLAVPVVIVTLKAVRHYYDGVADELRETGPIELERLVPPTVVVVAQDWNRLSERAVKFALTISPDVVAVHLSKLEGPENEEHELEIRARWKEEVEAPVAAAGLNAPRLMLIPAPFRKIHEPLLRLIDKLDREAPERAVAVLIPETVKSVWWQNLLHMHRASALRRALLKFGGPHLTVVTVPWRVAHEAPEAE